MIRSFEFVRFEENVFSGDRLLGVNGEDQSAEVFLLKSVKNALLQPLSQQKRIGVGNYDVSLFLFAGALQLVDVNVSVGFVLEAFPWKQISDVANGRDRDPNLKSLITLIK